MSRRKKDQGLDFLVSILKTIAKNREGFTAPQLQVMLLAADRLSFIDSKKTAYVTSLEQPRALTNPEGTSPAPRNEAGRFFPVAEMLRKLEQGGDNATAENAETVDPSKQPANGEAIRAIMDK